MGMSHASLTAAKTFGPAQRRERQPKKFGEKNPAPPSRDYIYLKKFGILNTIEI